MRATRILTRGLVCGVLLLGLTATAKAGYTIQNDGAPVAGPGSNFTWNYTASIAGPVPVIPPDPPTDQISNGSFFEIYDFGGLVPGSIVSPAGWTSSIKLFNPPPPPQVILNHGDDPAIYNIIWTYTGGATILGPIKIAGFSAQSTTGSATVKDAVGRDFVPGSNPLSNIDSINSLNVPVPEPASVISMLIGGGLLGLFARRRLRNFV